MAKVETLTTRAGVSVPLPPGLVTQSLEAIEVALGGRAAIVAALAYAPPSADVIYLLGLIGDPFREQEPLAHLCAQGGVTPGELLVAYHAGELARAHALSARRIGKRLDAVAEDTMRKALRHQIVCGTCAGTGRSRDTPTKTNPHPRLKTCDTCQGTKQVTREGDLDHKKLALDMGGLLQKAGGMHVNVNQQVGVVAGTGGSLEAMAAATDAILYGDQTPVDAELVPPEPSRP